MASQTISFPEDQDKRFTELALQKKWHAVFLKDHRENLRIFIESITKYPATIVLENTGHRADPDLQSYSQIVELPLKISIFPDSERNRQTFVLLAAMRAASQRYVEGYTSTTLLSLLKKAYSDGKKRFKKKNPVTEKNIYATGSGVYLRSEDKSSNFFAHFEHGRYLESLFSSLELGRMMSCLYRDYPPIKEWCRDILPHFYLYAHIPLAAHCALDGSKDEVLKETLLKSLLLRLPFELMLQSQTFDTGAFEGIEARQFRIYNIRARHHGIAIEKEKGARLEELVAEADRCFELALSLRTEAVQQLIPFYEKGTALFEKGTSLEQSLGLAVDMYFMLYDLIVAGIIPPQNRMIGISAEPEDPSTQSVVRTIETICSPHSIRSKSATEGRDAERAYAQRRFSELEGVPSYHEWDETRQQRLPRHAHIKELVWDPNARRFRDIHKPPVEKPSGRSNKLSRSSPKYSTEPPRVDQNAVLEFALKQAPFPPVNEEIVQRITAQLLLLKPEEYSRTVRLRRGTLDTREHTRYHAKVSAGVPVRPNFFYALEKHERSVASLVLLDVSDSTGELLNAQYTVLDMMKQGCLSFVQGLVACDDPVAVYAATSKPVSHERRLWTFFHRLKDFDDSAESLEEILQRVAPLYNNRDGAVIRHGTHILAQRPEKTRLLVYISDGEPHDQQIPIESRGFYNPKYSGKYAWADISMALREARAVEVTPLIIRVHDTETKNLRQIARLGAFFRTVKPDMSNLVPVLSEAYIHLTK